MAFHLALVNTLCEKQHTIFRLLVICRSGSKARVAQEVGGAVVVKDRRWRISDRVLARVGLLVGGGRWTVEGRVKN